MEDNTNGLFLGGLGADKGNEIEATAVEQSALQSDGLKHLSRSDEGKMVVVEEATPVTSTFASVGSNDIIRYTRGLLNSRLLAVTHIKKDAKDILSRSQYADLLKRCGEDAIDNGSLTIAWDFSTPQQVMLAALIKLNKAKSLNTKDKSREDYYKGNGVAKMIGYKEAPELPMQRGATIRTNLAEVTKYYTNDAHPSGRDQKDAAAVLYSLAMNNYPVFFTLEGRKPILLAKPLLHDYVHDTATNEISFTLNLVFTDGIESNYIAYPADINSKLVTASQSKKPSAGYGRLHDYLIRDKSNGHYTNTISMGKLCGMVAPDKVRARAKGIAISKTIEALNGMVKIGLVESFSPDHSDSYEDIVTIHLNKEYPKEVKSNGE